MMKSTKPHICRIAYMVVQSKTEQVNFFKAFSVQLNKYFWQQNYGLNLKLQIFQTGELWKPKLLPKVFVLSSGHLPTSNKYTGKLMSSSTVLPYTDDWVITQLYQRLNSKMEEVKVAVVTLSTQVYLALHTGRTQKMRCQYNICFSACLPHNDKKKEGVDPQEKFRL